MMQSYFTLAPPVDAQTATQAQRLFAAPCRFVTGAASFDTLPAADRIEICFAGRSNVGKSSLLNALSAQKNLARVSNTPGRTQQINFFTLAHSHYLVDIPGYGFASAPVPIVAQWQNLLKNYLSRRVSLRRVFLLIDVRHGIKAIDLEIMILLTQAAVVFQIVFSKSDKVKPHKLDRVIEKTKITLENYPTAFTQLLLTSAKNNSGISTLRATIATLV